MKTSLNIIILLLSVVLTTQAQNRQLTEINNIKKSKEYLYSDITMSTPEEAMSEALNQLQREILNWASDRVGRVINDVPPTELNKVIETMTLRRADMYRVFAYAKKFSIAASPYFIKIPLVMDGDLDSDDGNIEKPQNEPKDTTRNVASADSLNQTPVSKEVLSLLKSSFLGGKDGVLEKIKRAKTFFELKEIMEPLRDQGEITGYGKYLSALHPEECYLVVYDEAGNIKALLGKGDESRPNLKTGQTDSTKNYRGCGAIWFTIKENNNQKQ